MNNLLGKILGNRYVLLEKIGDGGMSLVYKARCQLLNRYVAVKILRPEFITDEEFIIKFKRESLAAASLSHPNIVGIYDVGEQDGIYYIVMEYINGKTLKEHIKEKGKLDYKETLEISSKIALALENAHKNGVAHRDIKPHNILINDDGVIKVTDFGIARASTSSTMTNTGRIMGSVHYFSPEQARGGFSDHRTDIYSLGVVMYEMLTGKLPYDADSPISIAIKHIQESFVEPLEVDSSIPKAVNDIVVKAMEKDMANRYQSSREIINEIQLAQKNPEGDLNVSGGRNEHTRVIPVEDIGKAIEDKNKKKKKRKRIWITLIVLVTLFIIGTLFVYGYNKFFVVPEAQIPKIIGINQEEAEKILKERNLKMEVIGRRSDKLPEDYVIQVIPDEGSNVKENSTVKVMLSSGPEKAIVPDLRNLSLGEAEAKLIGAGLVRGAIERKKSNDVEKDRVIEQRPAPETDVIAGSEVSIIISDGPEIKYVSTPILIGKTIEDVKKELAKINLVLGDVKFGYNKKYIDGVVIEQSPKPGSDVKEGTKVEITINSTKGQQGGDQTGEENND